MSLIKFQLSKIDEEIRNSVELDDENVTSITISKKEKSDHQILINGIPTIVDSFKRNILHNGNKFIFKMKSITMLRFRLGRLHGKSRNDSYGYCILLDALNEDNLRVIKLFQRIEDKLEDEIDKIQLHLPNKTLIRYLKFNEKESKYYIFVKLNKGTQCECSEEINPYMYGKRFQSEIDGYISIKAFNDFVSIIFTPLKVKFISENN